MKKVILLKDARHASVLLNDVIDAGVRARIIIIIIIISASATYFMYMYTYIYMYVTDTPSAQR